MADKKQKAVIFDRDGTLIIDKEYLSSKNGVELYPDTKKAIVKLKENGYIILVVTNQSGIGRGYYGEKEYFEVEQRVDELLSKNGTSLIVETKFCPHSPNNECECRKPKTKLADELIEKYNIDRNALWVVGDKYSDVMLGVNLGGKSILVLTGVGEKNKAKCEGLSKIAKDLTSAVNIILESKND